MSNRKPSDSISYIVQAHYGNEEAKTSITDIKNRKLNVLETSDKYGYLFVSNGTFLHVIPIPSAEENFDSGESLQSYESEYSFKIDCEFEIVFLTLSASESVIAVLAGGILIILSVPNLLLSVSKWIVYCECDVIKIFST